MPELIPSNNSERIVWLNNFKQGFADLADRTGFSAEEVEKVAEACDTLIFSINLALQAKLFSKVCTMYRDENFKSERRKVIAVPRFVLPDVPAKLAPANALGYLQQVARQIKAQPNYMKGTGARLGIESPKVHQMSRDEAQPTLKIYPLANSVVRINWVKRNFEGVSVESKRGDEDWTEISRDLHSPFIDTRPPLVFGQPEQRFYRLIYLVDDQPFGKYSPIYSTVTNPK